MTSNSENFKALPSVDKVLQSVELQSLIERVGRESVKLLTRQRLDDLRQKIAANDEATIGEINTPEFISNFCQSIKAGIEAEFSSSLVPVVNLSGTVVHTNLGRACLPQEAVQAMATAASHATNLEFDLDTGSRGDRDAHIERILCDITGAEAATVVNNNAAAVLLVLNTLAEEREVVISRGELVEIGGAFRIPDVMKAANCTLKEIGTTNRTHLRDYESAITGQTALLMKVHTSNYEIRGFTNSVAEDELSKLAHSKGIPFVSDLGSGTLVDLAQYGLPHEPTVGEVLEQGVDLVTFSGDKLLGGPQAGIIVGSKELVQKVKNNPLRRALRIDKITLAALVEVLNLYKDPARLTSRLPLLADLTRPPAEIQAVAEAILAPMQEKLAGIASVEVDSCKSQIGSGALPLDQLPSFGLVLSPIAEKGQSDARLQAIALAFRQLPRPVVGRVHDGRLIFDLRCLRDPAQLTDQLQDLRL